MNRKLSFTTFFLGSVAAVLFITASAKLVSAFGSAKILYLPDPLLSVPYKQLLLWAAALEFAILGVLLSGAGERAKLCLVGWAAGIFVLYRVASWLLGNGTPCPCLGTLSDLLRISNGLADAVLFLFVAYMATGSVLCWLSLSRNHRTPEQV
jgi:hypothetical protein